jgi:hypothetical protein
VQHGSFIDSTRNGVQASSFQRELFEDDERAFLFRLKNQPSPHVLEQIINYARAEVGTRYSIVEAARSVAKIRKPRSRRQFCSRLVAQAYKMAGIELVPDADYCSPEDLRRSPLLKELSVEFEPVSVEELAWRSESPNPIQIMHDAQNAVLDAARSVDPDVENFDDLHNLLLSRPECDELIAAALESSGYLDIWQIEVEKHPWRYIPGLIDGISASSEDMCEYCVSIIKEAYSGGVRFAINLVQAQALQRQHPRKAFCLVITLYEKLVRMDEDRREIAYDWLQRHYPEQLKQHMEEIAPHTPYWWWVIDKVEPQLAALSRLAVALEGNTEVCTSCGDHPASLYRLVNGADTMPGVPSLRLCDDCIDIRRGMGNVLMPFISVPGKT